jgi:hypothetical protein
MNLLKRTYFEALHFVIFSTLLLIQSNHFNPDSVFKHPQSVFSAGNLRESEITFNCFLVSKCNTIPVVMTTKVPDRHVNKACMYV